MDDKFDHGTSSNDDDSADAWFDEPDDTTDAGAPRESQSGPQIRPVPTPKEQVEGDWFDEADSFESEATEPVPAIDEPVEPEAPMWPDDDERGPKKKSDSPVAKAVKAMAILVGAFAVLALIGVLIVKSVSGSGDEEPTALPDKASASLAPAPAANTSAAAAEQCESSETGDTVTGDGAGDTSSVPGVVLAFENAYYNDRDAKKAIDLTTDDSVFRADEAVATLQSGIDSLPKGTTHCVEVHASGDDARVTVTQSEPGGKSEEFVQQFSTARKGDKVQIVDIKEEP